MNQPHTRRSINRSGLISTDVDAAPSQTLQAATRQRRAGSRALTRRTGLRARQLKPNLRWKQQASKRRPLTMNDTGRLWRRHSAGGQFLHEGESQRPPSVPATPLLHVSTSARTPGRAGDF